MQYLGGKSRIAKRIAAHLEALAAPGALIEDRFCGGLSVAAAIKHRPLRVADANAALVCTLRAVQDGWVPPDSLSESEYAVLKATRDPADPLTAFAAAGCSFGAKWWGGYARAHTKPQGYAGFASRSLLRKLGTLVGVPIECADYRDPPPGRGNVVYLDPPYADAVGYPGCGEFDHADFWATIETWARRGVIVRVSEYAAPAGWIAVETYGEVQQLGRSIGAKRVRIDRLWKLVDGP